MHELDDALALNLANALFYLRPSVYGFRIHTDRMKQELDLRL